MEGILASIHVFNVFLDATFVVVNLFVNCFRPFVAENNAHAAI